MALMILIEKRKQEKKSRKKLDSKEIREGQKEKENNDAERFDQKMSTI